MMKVLFVINSSNNGGAIKMIVTLYSEMAKRFPTSRIVFLRKIESQYSTINNAYYLSDRLTTPSNYLSVYKKLKRVISQEQPNVIISFLPLANIYSGILGKKMNIKTRIASQRNPPQIYGRVVRFLDRFIGSRGYYTANVCNSEAGMHAFAAYPKRYKGLLSVINNCVEKADLSLSVQEAKAQMGFTDDKIVITCVGRLHDQKNHQILVKAMKYIENATLYCAGNGPLYNEITNLINSEGVKDKVSLLGDLDRDQVRLLLRATDVFVMSSKYEGLSNSLIEAMSYGLPVVFSNIPSFTSFMKNQGSVDYAGVLVEREDEREWAAAINGLMQNEELSNLYREHSLNRVEDLTPEKMTTKFIDLFYEKK